MQVQQTIPLLQHFEGCRHAEGEKTANGLLGESSGRQPTAPTEAGLTLPAGSLLSVGLNLKRGRPSLQQCRDLRTGGSTRNGRPEEGQEEVARRARLAAETPPAARSPARHALQPHTHSGRCSAPPASRLPSSSRSFSAAGPVSPPPPPLRRCRALRLAMPSVGERAELRTLRYQGVRRHCLARERCPLRDKKP